LCQLQFKCATIKTWHTLFHYRLIHVKSFISRSRRFSSDVQNSDIVRLKTNRQTSVQQEKTALLSPVHVDKVSICLHSTAQRVIQSSSLNLGNNKGGYLCLLLHKRKLEQCHYMHYSISNQQKFEAGKNCYHGHHNRVHTAIIVKIMTRIWLHIEIESSDDTCHVPRV
jgi:hypothetical protein